MSSDTLATFAAAMFSILNPIGGAALFSGMVADRSGVERRAIAVKCGLAVAVILVVTVWAGEGVLRFFGVSIPSLEAAGGLIIASIGLSMLRSRPNDIHASEDRREGAGEGESIAVVPLAMPIVAGPGAMVTVLVYTHRHHGIGNNVELSLVCVTMAALVAGCFFLSVGPITRVLGGSGLDVVTKLLGLMLLAIAIGMLATGAKGLLPGLAA
jgi:multiple antibiotic resistance protein